MKTIVKVESLKKYFPLYGGLLSRVMGQVKAVDDISFEIKEGEILGVVGESGCGKTTVGRMTLRLIEPTSGKVFFEGTDILSLKGKELAMIRPKMQIIFQDPYSSLNPRFTVQNIIGEALSVHGLAKGDVLKKKIESLMDQVGLSKMYLKRFPHEFSGGQRQRIGIARALALNPKYIVCDEPVSALDVSIRAQVMNLLVDLQETHSLSYLLIAHNLATVRYMAHQTAVMYLGQIVEYADTEQLFREPLHPYTKALFSASLPSHPDLIHEEIVLVGEVPSPIDPPQGCHFHPRCPFAMDKCSTEVPKEKEISPGYKVSCHLY